MSVALSGRSLVEEARVKSGSQLPYLSVFADKIECQSLVQWCHLLCSLQRPRNHCGEGFFPLITTYLLSRFYQLFLSHDANWVAGLLLDGQLRDHTCVRT